ncbi:tetratricopeptide repeat-containing sensor histidine kinase [Chitinophagaceae bacterium MMS25-I14]
MRAANIITIFILFFFSNISAQQLPHSLDSNLQATIAIKNDTARMQQMYLLARKAEAANPQYEITIANMLLKEAHREHDRFNEARADYALGNAYKELTQYPQSLQYFLAALQIRKELKDYEAQIDLCMIISQIYDFTQDMQQQKNYILEANEICSRNNVTSKKGFVLDELATIYKKSGNLDTAIRLYHAGIDIDRQLNDTDAIRASLCNLAIALKSKKEYNLSLETYKQALQLTDTTHELYAYGIITDNMAILFYEMGDYKNAKTYASRALALADNIREPTIERDLYEVLKNIAVKENNYKAAVSYYDKWIAARDTMLNSEQSQQIKELQAKYDIKEKDKQISDQENQLSYNHKLNLFLAVCSVLLLAIGIIIYRSQRRTDRLNRTITEQKKELEQVNAVKDRIFSVISHDLRTPVNSLMTFMQLLEHGNVSPEKLQAYAAVLKSNLGYTTELMANLLSWARSQMHGYKAVPEQFYITDIALQTIEPLLLEAKNKNITLTDNISTATIVFADIQMTALILRNLLSNAIKYTPPDGTITLSAERKADRILIHVRDTGTGVSNTFTQRFNTGVIQPFESTEGTNKEKGTGLGLMLCKTFAALMNGNITVTTGAGKGSIFTLDLPATLDT